MARSVQLIRIFGRATDRNDLTLEVGESGGFLPYCEVIQRRLDEFRQEGNTLVAVHPAQVTILPAKNLADQTDPITLTTLTVVWEKADEPAGISSTT